MALEDFFTLTEMKDGLATVSRVEELISVMQNQKDSLSNNIVDAARQWSTVASVLATTENKSCLDQFVQLNGHCSLNQWLEEAEKCGTSDGLEEELITLLLGALQRLPLDREKLISSGINFTVKKLIGLENPNIQLKARSLLDLWDLEKEGFSYQQDEEKNSRSSINRKNDRSISEGAQSNGSADESLKDNHGKMAEDMGSTQGNSPHINDNSCKLGSEVDALKNVDLLVPAQSNFHDTLIPDASTSPSGNSKTSLPAAVSSPYQENTSAELEKPSDRPVGAIILSSACKSPAVERKVDEPEFLQTVTASNGSKEMEVEKCTVDTGSCEDKQKEAGLCASLPLSSFPKEQSDVKKMDCEEAEIAPGEIHEFQHTNNATDLPKYSSTLEELPVATGTSPKGRPEGSDTSHGIKALGSSDKNKEAEGSYLLASKEESQRRRRSSKSRKRTKNASESRSVKHKVALDYGDDALELAVQVAIEAKREVADRERHSSSDGYSEADETSSSELEEDMHGQEGFSESSTKTDNSDDNSRPDTSQKLVGNTQKYPEQEEQSQKPSPVTSEKTKCIFDLNEDIFAEDMDTLPIVVSNVNNQNSLSAPVAVVAVPKGAPGLPATPLHFEGGMGWRGSAATSAFRPASPRRTSDGEKTVSGPKQKVPFLVIDLNIAEEMNEEVDEPIMEKQIPNSCGLPSGESSVEVTSSRADRLKLDLNRLGDDNTFTNSSYWKLHHQNRNGSPSPASSSSAKQSSMRDIDLNDNPSFIDSNVPHNTSRGPIDLGGLRGEVKLDDPVVTIMGSKVSLDRKESMGHHLPLMGNTFGMDPKMGTRSLMAYPQTLVGYGYNGPAMGPPLSVPSAMYGPGSYPYMVDSRGATVVPQIIGSSAALNGTHSTRPPFLVNVGGIHSGLGFGAVGGTRPSFDLNTASMSLDGGNREIGGLRQFLMPVQGGPTEGQIRPASQPGAASGVGMKLKESDCGRETYPIGYKQVTSWE